jgi:hypothetical protein
MKNRIIEICELGKPQSIIHRENEPITELIKTTDLVEELNKQLILSGVMPSVYVVTYNDDYGRPIFDNCFNDKTIAEEYIQDHDYLRMDNTTVIKEMDFE